MSQQFNEIPAMPNEELDHARLFMQWSYRHLISAIQMTWHQQLRPVCGCGHCRKHVTNALAASTASENKYSYVKTLKINSTSKQHYIMLLAVNEKLSFTEMFGNYLSLE